MRQICLLVIYFGCGLGQKSWAKSDWRLIDLRQEWQTKSMFEQKFWLTHAEKKAEENEVENEQALEV